MLSEATLKAIVGICAKEPQDPNAHILPWSSEQHNM